MPIKTTVEILMNKLFPTMIAFIYTLQITDPFSFALLKALTIALIVKFLLYMFAKEINKIALKTRAKLKLTIIKIRRKCQKKKK